MKKIISLMLTLTLVFALTVTASAAGFKAETDANVVKAGDKVTVTVKLDETIPASAGATMIQGELTYNDSELTCNSVTKSDAYSFLTCVVSTRNPIVKFNFFDTTSTAHEFKAGTVVTVEFTATKEMTVSHLTSTLKLTVLTQTAAGTDVVNETSNAEIIICKNHTWDEGKVTTEPTCAKEGVKTYTCTYDGCGATKTEKIAATGEHTWDEGKVTTKPTCVKEGVKTYTCDCGATKTEEIAATGEHSWNEGKVTTKPTCVKEGVKTYTCDCGATKTEAIAADKDAHVWDEGKVTTEPTCTEAGVKTFTCTEDGCEATKTEAIAALGHKGGEATTEKKAVCEVCGEEYGELLSDETTGSDETTKADETVKSDETTKSDETVKADETAKSDETAKADETVKSDDAKTPATGDSSMAMIFVVAMILAAGTVVVIRKRRME